MVLLGLGAGAVFATLNPVVMAAIGPQDAGAAGGVLQTMQQLGATLGLAVLVTVFGAESRRSLHGGAAPQHAFVAGVSTALLVAAGLAAALTVAALALRGQSRG
jgi:hypothetical protein